MHHENVRALREVREARIGAVLVRAQDDGDPLRLHAVGERGKIAVRNTHRGNLDAIAIIDGGRLLPRHVHHARIELHAGARSHHRTQDLPGAALGIEQAREKIVQGGCRIVPRRSRDGEGVIARIAARPQHARQVGGMVGVQMAHEDHGEIGKLRLGLAEAHIGAATRIDENPRLIADPEQVTRIRAVLDEAGRARAQYLHRHGITRATLRQCTRRRHQSNGHAGNQRPEHESPPYYSLPPSLVFAATDAP